MINTGLKNKVVIVTGANHGIGAATAIAFAKEGAKVFINYLRQSPELYGETKDSAERATTPGRAYYCKMISRSAERVISKINDLGGECYAGEADLSQPNNITTDGARCHASNVSYGASKYAIESYTRSAAVELGPFGITVNVISPGAVQTGWMPKELEKKLAESYPLRRIGKPEDIAKAVIFFASQQAGWITGQVLYVGGGNRM